MSPIDPNSENWKDGWQTRDAELGLIVQEAVRDELASLGGHLLATYGDTAFQENKHDWSLARLGGYLLEHYGSAGTPLRGVEDGGEGQEGGVHHIADDTPDVAPTAYRDPEPPAVGEPPTTTPGGTDEPGT